MPLCALTFHLYSCGKQGLETIKEGDVIFKFFTSSHDYNKTTVLTGQISKLSYSTQGSLIPLNISFYDEQSAIHYARVLLEAMELVWQQARSSDHDIRKAVATLSDSLLGLALTFIRSMFFCTPSGHITAVLSVRSWTKL